jgi:O-antigen/teichoic acid export membrane protein
MSIRRHTLYNLLGSLAPIVVTIVTVPLYLRLVGDVRYGVLALVWLFLGYFGLFDPGLARAAAYHIARLHQAPARDRENVFWTALVINLGFGIIGGVVFYLVARPFFVSALKMPEAFRHEVAACMPWLAASIPVSIVSGVLGGVLQARERFGVSNVLNVANIFLTQVTPLAVAYFHGPDLTWLIPAILLARAAGSIPTFIVIAKTLPLGAGGGFDRSLVRTLFSYGGWITITNFITPILTTMDRMLIGSLLSAEAVAYYTVPFNFVTRAQIIPGALSSSLFPKFSHRGEAESRELADDAVVTLAAVMTPIVIAGIIALPTFMRLWVGTKFALQASPVGTILFVSVWVNGLNYIPYGMLQATNRPDLNAKAHLIEVIPFVLVLWAGIHFFGLPGAAWACVFRTLIDGMLVFFLAKQTGIWRRIWFGGCLVFVSQFCSPTFVLSVQTLLSVIVLLIAIAWSWYTSLRIRSILKRQFANLRPLLNV